jgi:hypothetical protein
MDLLQQQIAIHQSSTNPAAAPRLDVSINSPEPTMLPEITILGPNWRQRAAQLTGGGCLASSRVV